MSMAPTSAYRNLKDTFTCAVPYCSNEVLYVSVVHVLNVGHSHAAGLHCSNLRCSTCVQPAGTMQHIVVFSHTV